MKHFRNVGIFISLWLVLLSTVVLVQGTINNDPTSISLRGAFRPEGVPLYVSKDQDNYVFTGNHNSQTQTLTVYGVMIADSKSNNNMSVAGFLDILGAGCPNPRFFDVTVSGPFCFLLQCPNVLYVITFDSNTFRVAGKYVGSDKFVYAGSDVSAPNQINFMGPSPSYPYFFEIKTVIVSASYGISVVRGALLPFFSVESPNSFLSSVSFAHALKFIEQSVQMVGWQYVLCRTSTETGLCTPQQSEMGVGEFLYYFPVEVAGISGIKVRNAVNKTILGIQQFNLLNGENEGKMFLINATQLKTQRFVHSTLSLKNANGQYSVFMTVQSPSGQQYGVSQVEFNNIGSPISHNELYMPASEEVLGPIVANSKYIVFWTGQTTLTRLSYS